MIRVLICYLPVRLIMYAAGTELESSSTEAMTIRDTFFPGMRLEYLFAADDPPSPEQKAG